MASSQGEEASWQRDMEAKSKAARERAQQKEQKRKASESQIVRALYKTFFLANSMTKIYFQANTGHKSLSNFDSYKF
jgi:hypothetical protein